MIVQLRAIIIIIIIKNKFKKKIFEDCTVHTYEVDLLVLYYNPFVLRDM